MMLCSCNFWITEAQKDLKTNVTQVQVDYQTEAWYMVANVLKYESIDLIILYCCVYSGLLDTMGIVVWNSMRLMKNIGFGSQID